MTDNSHTLWRWLSIPCSLAIVVSANVYAQSVETSAPTTPAADNQEATKLCYPPYWGGLLPGFSTDSELVRLYGTGVFRETGYDGTRYYTDKQQRVTLSVSWATDRIIAEITIQRGYYPPVRLSKEERTAMISSTLDEYPTFGDYGALTLKSTMAEVRGNLGPPHSTWSDEAKGTTNWVYDSNCACDLPTGITFEFKADELLAVSFWSTPG